MLRFGGIIADENVPWTDADLAPLFAEKDYWVTQVLRSLHERRPARLRN
ncbi:MAG TPA: hypothetical protein VN845_04300 [Solirubrobacteraceae bacterium]|nr:hypothetical protein [Solirubrobacteraceae bacterium]